MDTRYHRVASAHTRNFSATEYFNEGYEYDDQNWYRYNGSREKMGQTNVSTVTPRSSRVKTALKFLPKFLALLWLAPIITLFYLNFTNHVIGASAWCPFGHCTLDPYAKDAFEKTSHFNHQTHNLFGVLQLVSKILEIWFIIIASSLVYTVLTLLARKGNGLPLALFPSPVEFADPRYMLSPKTWLASRSENGSTNGRKRGPNWILWSFLAFLTFMALVANLMGPAIAILLIPSLEQHKTTAQNEKVFDRMDSSIPPAGDSAIPFCTAEALLQLDYDCAYLTNALSLDAWIASGKAFDFQLPYVVSRWPKGTNPASNVFASSQALFAVSQEWAVSFVFNASSDDNVFWAPNRQVLRNLTGDLENYFETVKGIKERRSIESFLQNQDPILNFLTSGDSTKGFLPAEPDRTFEELTSSLQTALKRNGPVVGAEINFFQASSWRLTHVEPEQKGEAVEEWVFCMDGWSPLAAADPNWSNTKCYAVGSGWSSVGNFNDTVNFATTIPLQTNDTTTTVSTNVTLTLEMFYANRTAFFNSTTRPDTLEKFKANKCISRAISDDVAVQSGQCDWDEFFDSDALALMKERNDFPYVTENVHLIMLVLNNADSIDENSANSRFVIEFNPKQAIADYSLDTSPFTNKIRLAQIHNTPAFADAEPIYIHPSWLVAMLGGYQNKSSGIRIEGEDRLSPFVTDPTSSALEIASDIFDIAKRFPKGSPDLYQAMRSTKVEIDTVKAIVDYRSLFYISYLMTLHLCSILSFTTSTLPFDLKSVVPQSNILHRDAIAQVYAYGLDSRTSRFGVVIASIGAVITIVYFFLSIATGVREKSTAALLSACLKHQPQDEFSGCGQDETKLGRVRFTAQKDQYRMWKFEKVT